MEGTKTFWLVNSFYTDVREFHFSSECEPKAGEVYPRAFTFRKSRNPKPYAAGYAKGNILGSYLHLHFAGAESAAESFVEACLRFKEREA